MGVGAYACYKLTTLFPDVNILVWIVCVGLLLRRGRRAVRPAVAAHQGLLSRGRDARGAVLPVMVLHPHPLALQLQHLRRDRGADAHAVRHSDHRRRPRRRRRATSSCSPSSSSMTWLASNLVHGRIGRMWMAVRDMDIAAELIGIRLLPTKLLAFAVSSFYCGVAGALMVFLWYGGAEAGGVQHQPVLLHPVHGHHRRPRQPDRLVLRRGADLHPADRAALRAAGSSALPIQRGDRRAPAPS